MDSFDLLPSLADGELAESSAPELVAAIFRSHASGTLTIEAPESGEVRQFFRAGQMCGSAYFTGFRTLAQVLLEQEWAQALDVDESLAEAQSQGRRHGELLVEKGLLTAEQLGQVLAAQHRHNLMALMRLDRGHYEMRGWEPPPPWTRELNIDPLGPLFESLEEPRLAHRRALVLDWVGGSTVGLTPDWADMEPRAEIDATDRRAISQLAVARTRREFVAASRLPAPRAEALLTGLILIGAAEPRSQATAARPPSQPIAGPRASSNPPPPRPLPTPPPSAPPPRPSSNPPWPAARPASIPSQPSMPPVRAIPSQPSMPPARPASIPPTASAPAARTLSTPAGSTPARPRPRPSQPSLPPVSAPDRSPPRAFSAPPPPRIEEVIDLDVGGPASALPLGYDELELDESALPEAQLASNPGVERRAMELEPPAPEEDEPLELDLNPRPRPPPPRPAPVAEPPPVRDSNPFAMPTPAPDSSGDELRKKLRARGLRNVAGAAREQSEEQPELEMQLPAEPAPRAEEQAAVSREAQRFIDEVRARVRMLPAQNPWQRLGVSRKATNEQIHTAYLEAVKRYHPDRASALGAAAAQEDLRVLFAAIKEAHERIGTAAAREKYTALSNSNPGGASPRQEEATLALKMGDVLLKKRDFAAAMVKLRRAAELDPNGDTLAALAWGLLCDPAATPATRSEAELLIDRSLRVGGATARTHYVAGVSWRQRDPAAAGEAFKKALEIDPNHRAASQELRLLELRQARKK